MPWKIVERGGKHFVENKDTGKTEKCHDSEGDAKDHLSALYANAGDEAKKGK